MDRRSSRPRSLRDLALWSRRSTKPETFARLETRLLGLRSAPECRPRPDLLGYFRLDTGFSVGPNHCCHLLEGLDREHGAHLSVARLVAPHAWDRPELGEQAGPVAVDGNREPPGQGTGRAVHAIAVPLDLPVPAGDDGEPLGVGADPESIGLGQCLELLAGVVLLR